MAKDKKVKLTENSPLNQEVVSDLEELLVRVKPSELRKTVLAIYFDITIGQTDFSLDFQMQSLRIYELLCFLDVACEYETRREASSKNKKKKSKKG